MKIDHEQIIQKKLKVLLDKPSQKFLTTKGKEIIILSLGTINKFKGPDFQNSALIIDGKIQICDVEFDKRSSFWYSHNHYTDPAFRRVLLHISFYNDKDLDIDQIVISKDELKNIRIDEGKKELEKDVQFYALDRLLRRSTEAKRKIQRFGLEYTLSEYLDEFYFKFKQRKTRPLNTLKLLRAIIKIKTSSLFQSILYIDKQPFDSFQKQSEDFINDRNIEIGKHLKIELILNCFLPVCLSLSEDKLRTQILRWYWSEPAKVRYGILKEKFPNYSQGFLWQQQGLLEFLNNFEVNRTKEIEYDYSYFEILDFYRSVA